MDTVHKMPNYKIYYFGKSKYDKVVVERFYADDDAAALAHLNAVPANGKKLYYGTIHYVHRASADGKDGDPVDIEDIRHWCGNSGAPLWKRAWVEIADFFSYWLVCKPKDVWYWARDLVYLLKNKEAYSNQWNLDLHLLESIERNVPSLIKNSHALAFIDDAILELHGSDPGFDLGKYHAEHCAGYPREVEELASKIQVEEYSKLLEYVKLYKYYAAAGCIDFDNPSEVAVDTEYRSTLPIKPGTYDELFDYSKVTALANEYWGKIWDWVKKHGQKLCD